MNADDIEKSIKARIAEIDAQTTPLLKERARLQNMLGPQEVKPFVAPPFLPVMPSPSDVPVWPHYQPPLPYVPWTAPNTDRIAPIWMIDPNGITITTTSTGIIPSVRIGDITTSAGSFHLADAISQFGSPAIS